MTSIQILVAIYVATKLKDLVLKSPKVHTTTRSNPCGYFFRKEGGVEQEGRGRGERGRDKERKREGS